MSDKAIQPTFGDVMESVVIGGDLSQLKPAERVEYYKAVCASVGLNPLTRPFEYITLNGKLTLYARKDATDQLREKHSISIGKPDITFQDEWIIVAVVASKQDGRTDSDVGVVNKKDMRGDFGNALMKAVTKAKRRVTLSICGLGMLDETEVETIPTAKLSVVDENGELLAITQPEPAAPVIEYPAHLLGVTNSEGVRYVECGDEQLSYFAGEIRKASNRAKGDEEKQAQYSIKLDAIKEIKLIRSQKAKHAGMLDDVDAGLDPRDGMPFGDK